MKSGSVRKVMIVVSGATEENSDLELISTTGTVANYKQPSSSDDNLRSKYKKTLNELPASRHTSNLSSNLKRSDGKKEEYTGNRKSYPRNRLEFNDIRPEKIQETPKKEKCRCCQFCMLLLKFAGMLCYVFCCPPVPGMIIRKLAFHPLKKGKTYVVCGKDMHDNVVKTNNAKKASQFTSLKFEVQQLIEGLPISTEDVVDTSIIKTRRGSYLPILKIDNNLSSDKCKDLVVLFSQPNSSDLGCYFQPYGLNFRYISEMLKADLYAYDYSGYGISTGSPSEKNIYADIEAAYKHISESQGPRVRIALLGYSIGTVSTVYMASKHPPNLCGIVLLAPLASALRLYVKTDRTCCMDQFLSYDRAPQVNVPVLACHGCMDNIIPKSHSEILIERFPRAVAPLYVEEANHLTIFSRQNLSVLFRIRYFLFNETDPLQADVV